MGQTWHNFKNLHSQICAKEEAEPHARDWAGGLCGRDRSTAVPLPGPQLLSSELLHAYIRIGTHRLLGLHVATMLCYPFAICDHLYRIMKQKRRLACNNRPKSIVLPNLGNQLPLFWRRLAWPVSALSAEAWGRHGLAQKRFRFLVLA